MCYPASWSCHSTMCLSPLWNFVAHYLANRTLALSIFADGGRANRDSLCSVYSFVLLFLYLAFPNESPLLLAIVPPDAVDTSPTADISTVVRCPSAARRCHIMATGNSIQATALVDMLPALLVTGEVTVVLMRLMRVMRAVEFGWGEFGNRARNLMTGSCWRCWSSRLGGFQSREIGEHVGHCLGCYIIVERRKW